MDPDLLAALETIRRENREDHRETRAKVVELGERVSKLEATSVFQQTQAAQHRDWPARVGVGLAFIGMLINLIFRPFTPHP